MGVLCVQETRLKGNKARELGEDCKLFYSGADERGENGVGIVLSKERKDSLVCVSKTNDRVMSVKLGIGETVVNVRLCIRSTSGLCGGREGNLLETDGSSAQGNTRRRKGDCRMRPKRSHGDQ